MKLKILILFTGIIAFTACNDLDLNPLSEGSSESWYSNETEIDMALNDIYRAVFWPMDDESWTDDWTDRNSLSPISGGTINGEWRTVINLWKNSYKAISRANTILNNLDKVAEVIPQATLLQFEAEAKFVRASQYSILISHFGDVVYFTEAIDLEEAFTMSRTAKSEVLTKIYEDYDFAIANLPESYGNSDLKRGTKGTALGLKARVALYNNDWSVVRDATSTCMGLGYELYPNFAELFLSSTKNPNEVLFSMPRSTELGVWRGRAANTISRNAGGWGNYDPSWDLWCAYLCDDGLPIDESPKFNPQEPFENRDPRLAMSIVEFQTEHLGFMYQPHPDSIEVWNFKTGKYQFNHDTRTNKTYASFNALLWKKGVDEDWSDDKKPEVDKFIIRYADILLMYAEAKIELGEIDDSVLDAMNMIRARAYGVDKDDIASYPAITSTDQAELRKTVRIERRMELAYEGLRYMDIIRWRLAEKVLNTNVYGMLDPAELKEKLVDKGLWFFPEVPPVDEDGVPNFDAIYNQGLIKLLAIRSFDPAAHYLWPIPSKEVLINDNLSQNPGY